MQSPSRSRLDHGARATWRGAVLAESRYVVCIGCTHYFPPDPMMQRYLGPSRQTTVCPRRGIAHHFDGVSAGSMLHIEDTP